MHKFIMNWHLNTSLPLLSPWIQNVEVFIRLQGLSVSHLHGTDQVLAEKLGKKIKLQRGSAKRL
jgi:hypothetical protein